MWYATTSFGVIVRYFPSFYQFLPTDRSRQKLRSASTAALVVPVTRHSTLGDRAFPVIAAKLWNALPGRHHICYITFNFST